jgi:hypothetical protein
MAAAPSRYSSARRCDQPGLAADFVVLDYAKMAVDFMQGSR